MRNVNELLEKQRNYFRSKETRNIPFRKKQLKKVKQLLVQHENAFYEALKSDFGKPKLETFVSEIGFLIGEIEHTLAHIDHWASEEPVTGSLLSFPSNCKILKEPYGVCLIIAPWNYPLELAMSPLIGAIAAGNCAVIKPSEMAPATSSLIAQIIKEQFAENYIAVVEGGLEISQELLKHAWDKIFFTGSPQVGKIVMKAAAEHLTPVTLELGGKSPCLIDETANIKVAARKLAFGKYFNAGQTCIAPDYALVHQSKEQELLDEIKKSIASFYGESIEQSPDYARIINDKHFNRVSELIKGSKVAIGGKTNQDQKYIEPTVLTDVDLNSQVMKEEIFGPVLPVIPYQSIDEAVELILSKPKPLAFYLFTKNTKRKKELLEEIPFGGGSVNETLEHFINKKLPFGGVGSSGLGSYHGKYSFDAFSHEKSVLSKPSWADVPIKYPPYKNRIGLFKALFKIGG